MSALASAPDVKVQVLCGLGGLGKTTVGLLLAQELRTMGRLVWWVEATSRSHIENLLLRVAQDELGAPVKAVEEALAGRRNAADVFWKAIRRAGKGDEFALVLDNADDPQAVLAAPGGQVCDGNGWIRVSQKCLTIVTSRDRDPATWGPLCDLHEIKPISVESAALVLRDLAPRAPDPECARALAQRLYCLPLALHLAGASIAWTRAEYQSFAAYLGALQQGIPQLLDPHPRSLQLIGQNSDRRIITRTWQLSLQTLQRQDVNAAAVLAITMAQLADAHTIPQTVLDPNLLASILPGTTSHDVHAALEALTRVGLIDDHSDENVPGMRLHPLVAETLRAAPPSVGLGSSLRRVDAIRLAWMTALRALRAATAGVDPYCPGHWPMGALLEQHLRALIERSPAKLRRVWVRELHYSAAAIVDTLREYGSYSRALNLAQATMAMEPLLPGRDSARLKVHHSMANVLHKLGRFADAEAAFRSLLAYRERAFGSGHPETLLTRHNLATTLHKSGKVHEAEEGYRSVLVDRERVLGADHPHTMLTRHNLGLALHDIGRFRLAEKTYREVLCDQTRVLGPDHPQTLRTQHNLATVLHDRKCIRGAGVALAEVLAARERVLGVDHPDTLLTRHNFAVNLHERGKSREAQDVLRKVLADRERVLGQEHPHTELTRRYLASVSHDGEASPSETPFEVSVKPVQLPPRGV
ncbi:tetratricopeptide repeat protein [Nonomuraea gerenzanensis]|uniref:tetratricopeptide repeat protein n=1 Tax=Nonomuraea gerenzanensis TaxID=93944 RepID=UPI001CDA3383|nr:tetratricopeptide repeat protein [Nonomuraea gerenzanensis]UBU16344.1 tetratricopeptide repeat protein [Nonomuraea gerenzanensis]